MKAIVSSRRNSVNFVNSSSVRNSLGYVVRAQRISVPRTDTKLSSLDTVKRVSHYLNRMLYVHEEYDRLQYILAYSNNNLHQDPRDIFSIARGKAVTAENLYEEAEEYFALAASYRKKAEILYHDAAKYKCGVYREYAAAYEEDAEYYETEARLCYDRAIDMEKSADYFQYEAENMVKEEEFVSGWESWLDM